MEHVNLRRRREDHARRKPEALRQRAARNPLFLFGAGFLLGCVVLLFFYNMLYMGDFSALSLFMLTLALLLYTGWRPSERGAERSPSGSGLEKQLLMAIQDAGGTITPVEAALGTSLTVDEAEEILTRFADRGHLVVHSQDGALLYALPGRRPTPEPRTV